MGQLLRLDLLIRRGEEEEEEEKKKKKKKKKTRGRRRRRRRISIRISKVLTSVDVMFELPMHTRRPLKRLS